MFCPLRPAQSEEQPMPDHFRQTGRDVLPGPLKCGNSQNEKKSQISTNDSRWTENGLQVSSIVDDRLMDLSVLGSFKNVPSSMKTIRQD